MPQLWHGRSKLPVGDRGSGEAWISVVPDRRLPGVLGAYAVSLVGRREVPLFHCELG